jgi:O-antigen/teichoic acid export membrane protein
VAGLLYGAASLLANALGYAFLVVLSRGLDPGAFGELGSLLGFGIVASVLSVALQLVVARQTAAARTGRNVQVASRRYVLALSAAVSLVALAVAPMVVHYLRLDSVWPAFWIALTLFPMTAIGALNGHLLGLERFRRLAVAVVLVAALRLLSGILAVFAGWGVTGCVAALAVATCVAGVAVSCLALPDAPGAPATWRQELTETLGAAQRVAGFLLLANLDVLLARHYLSARDSGLYVLGSLFAKAGLWGPQFIAVLAYPRLSAGRARTTTFVHAAAWTATLGGLVALAALLLARPLVRGFSGDEYLGVAHLAPWFALMGTALALVHLCMVTTLAVGERTYGAAIWGAAALESLVVSLGPHDGLGQILGICLIVCVALAIAGAGLLMVHRSAERRFPIERLTRPV